MNDLKERKKLSCFRKNFNFFLEKHMFLLTGYRKKKKIIRIPLPLNLLWQFDPLISRWIILEPEKFFPEAEITLKNFCQNNHLFKKSLKKEFYNVKFDLRGPFQNGYSSVKSLKPRSLGELVYLRGIVIECEKKKIQHKKIIHYCPSSEKFFVNNQQSLSKVHYSLQRDSEGNSLEIEYGLSIFEDHQRIILQDPIFSFSRDPPESIIVVLEKDLVDSCKPGEKVEICGILKPISAKKNFLGEKIFSMAVFGLSLRPLKSKNFSNWTKTDDMMIKSFSSLSNCFERLSSLVAPGVFGQDLVKKGILLSLIGGKGEKKQTTHLKEQINFLLIGGFSGQKEKFLHFISKFSYSIPFFSKEYFPESYLFDFYPTKPFNVNFNSQKNLFFTQIGTLCVQNIDKFSQQERNILKEVIDHQPGSLGEGKGVHSCSFNLAATVNNAFNQKSFFALINNEDNSLGSLISRFDCIFFLSDQNSLEQDKKIARHFFRNYVENNFKDEFTKKDLDLNFKQKFLKDHLSYNFFKTFISFAKTKISPILTEGAIDAIINSYLYWRFQSRDSFPVTIRKLESITRLSIAYSKCHLREMVFSKDVKFINQFLKKLAQGGMQIKNPKKNFSPRSNKIKYAEDKTISKTSKKKTKEKNYWITKEGGFFFDKKITGLKKNEIRFSNFKEILKTKNMRSSGERTLVEWFKKNLCIIFQKTIIKF